MTDVEEDLDQLFETDGKIEDFRTEAEDTSDGRPGNDLDELLALVDDEESNKDDEADSKLEDEYLELQRKMKEIEGKMQRKKSSSPQSVNKVKPDISPPTASSSFLAAFGDASFTTSKPEPNLISMPDAPLKNFSKSNGKRPAECQGNEAPEQKKRRLAHLSITSAKHQGAGHPFTESLRGRFDGGKTTQQQKNGTSKKTQRIPSQPEVVETERFSRIRLRKCFVPAEEMKDRMQNKRFLKLSLIRCTMKMSADTDWVTIGVVAKQLDRQSAKNGKPFSIWNLTDLDDCTKTVTFFLFGKVHEKLHKEMTVGSVIGILNPEIMPPKKESSESSFDNTPALTVDVPERVMHVGIAADLGWCTATKYRNKQPAGKCMTFINKQVSDTCIIHMRTKYKKMGARRSELQGSVAAPVAKKYKDTMWNKVKNDQFFYGGKVYSAAPAALAAAAKPKEPKVKLTKFLSDYSGLSAESKTELMERSKVIKALSGIDEAQSVSGCSPAFADMLSSGDNVAGSRQYLNHLKIMQTEEEEKKKDPNTPSLSAAQVLKQQALLIEAKRKKELVRQKLSEIKKQSVPHFERSTSLLDKLQAPADRAKTQQHQYVSAADIRKQTAAIIKAKKAELSSTNGKSPPTGSGPKLGQGIAEGSQVDLFGDWLGITRRVSAPSTPSPEVLKRKAIAKLRNDDGKVIIKKKNPNTGVLKQVVNIRENEKIKCNILKKVKENEPDEDEMENCDVEKQACNKMDREEYNRILNTHSAHSDAVEESQLEEQEKYFNPLIRKEMMEQKMAETYEVSCKVVRCRECMYTFWAPHERCKMLQHHLQWQSAKKRFFQCSQCKQRTSTWETYPSRPCAECGSVKNWHRTSMLRDKDIKILDTEILMIRGLEHGKFLNSLK